MAGQIILSVAYGVDVRPEGDPHVENVENVFRAVTLGTNKDHAIFDTTTWCNVAFCSYLKSGILTIIDASLSTPYAEMVSLQTSCPPHFR